MSEDGENATDRYSLTANHRRRIISARRNISALGFWRTFEWVRIIILT